MALVFIGHLLITNISLDMFSLVVGMPSYETWSLFHRSHKLEKDWEGAFQTNEKQYPWSSKINKAVWRGSTTYEGSQYHESELGETPRGKLVKTSMEHSNLIDGSFNKINQKFQSRRHELADQFTVSKRISPRGMMNYKGLSFICFASFVLSISFFHETCWQMFIFSSPPL